MVAQHGSPDIALVLAIVVAALAALALASHFITRRRLCKRSPAEREIIADAERAEDHGRRWLRRLKTALILCAIPTAVALICSMPKTREPIVSGEVALLGFALLIGIVALAVLTHGRRNWRKLPAATREILAEERAAWKAGRAERWRSDLHMARQSAITALVLVIVLAIAIPALLALPPFVLVVLWIANAANECANERAARLESELRALRAEMSSRR